MSKYNELLAGTNIIPNQPMAKAVAALAEQERIANLIKLMDYSAYFSRIEVIVEIKRSLDLTGEVRLSK